MNMTALEAFVVAKSSPNNIFADSVYHSDRELWSDVISAYRIAENNLPDYILERLEDIRLSQEYKSREEKRNQLIAEAIREDMQSLGRLYYSTEYKRAFFDRGSQLIGIDERNTELRAFIDGYYKINPASREFKFVVYHLKAVSYTHLTLPTTPYV